MGSIGLSYMFPAVWEGHPGDKSGMLLKMCFEKTLTPKVYPAIPGLERVLCRLGAEGLGH